MKQKMYEVQEPKKKKNVIKVEFDILKAPSPVHKFGALNNKAVRFDDRRKRKPKHKNKDIDW